MRNLDPRATRRFRLIEDETPQPIFSRDRPVKGQGRRDHPSSGEVRYAGSSAERAPGRAAIAGSTGKAPSANGRGPTSVKTPKARSGSVASPKRKRAEAKYRAAVGGAPKAAPIYEYIDLDEPDKSRRTPTDDRLFSSSRSNSTSFSLGALVSFLVLVGAAMVLSTSFVPSLGSSGQGSPFAIFERQFIWIIGGFATFFFVSRVNPRRIAPVARLLLIPTVLVLLVVLVPGVGVTVGGSSRWIGVSFLRFQPSELAKLAVVLYLAGFFTPAVPERLRSFRAALPAIWLVGMTAFLILIEPDMGTTLVIGTILLGVLFLAGMRMRIYAPFALGVTALSVVAALAQSYRRQRLLSFLHPWQNRLLYSYQEVQGLVAFATGGAHGVGLGAGSAKWGYLPNAQTDFIYAVLGQEAGLIGCLVVLAALALLVALVMRIALRASSRFEFLICAGVALWLGAQTLFNVGAVLGVLPVTGVPLPLISAGGSSLLVLMAALGLVYGVAKRPAEVLSVP